MEGILNEEDEIIKATSGNKAVMLMQSQGPVDCVISDYNMPDGQGIVVQQYLLDNKINIPFYICTAHDVSFLKKNLPVPPIDFIFKPFNFARIKEIVKKHMGWFAIFIGNSG